MQINLHCPINSLGYGYTSLNILKSLSKIAEVSLWPIGVPQVTNSEDAKIIESAIKNNATADLKGPCIKIWHQHDMEVPTHLIGPTIGFPIFELDTFTNVEVSQLNKPDHLFVPSQWAVDIIRKNGIKTPTKVIPLGVDLNIFKPCHVEAPIPKVFFNCGKWEIRKGHDILIDMWNQFNSRNTDGDWELWMMCENPFNTPQEESLWRKAYSGKNIRLIPRVETHQQVYNIMSQVGCGIFPSRGEGWNLELLELMACGKHCITTKYAAHTQFCDELNSSLITPKTTEAAFDGKWFFGRGNWAKLDDGDISEFVDAMVEFASQPKYNHHGVLTASEFTWDLAVKDMMKYVTRI